MEEGRERGRNVNCNQAAQHVKLDPIHTMPAGHEGSSNDYLLGIWKWERQNE